MQILILESVSKYLDKRSKTDIKGVRKINNFIVNELANSDSPTSIGNCKKLKGFENKWRWKISDYRIIGSIEKDEFKILKIEKIEKRNSKTYSKTKI